MNSPVQDLTLRARLRAARGECVRLSYNARCYQDGDQRIPLYGMARVPASVYTMHTGVAEGIVEELYEHVVIIRVRGIRVAMLLASITAFVGKLGVPSVE